MHLIYQYLKKLGLIAEASTKFETYTFQSSNRWDFQRLIDGRPYYHHIFQNIQTEPTTLHFKTLIINNASAITLGRNRGSRDFCSDISFIYNNLLELGFVICVRVDANKYINCKNKKELIAAFKNIKLTEAEIIEEELKNFNSDLNDIVIINENLRRQLLILCNKFFDSFVMTGNRFGYGKENRQTNTFWIENLGNINTENKSCIAKDILSSQYDFVGYVECFDVPVDEDAEFFFGDLFIKWNNTFVYEEIMELLSDLQSATNLDYWVEHQQLYEIEIEDEDEQPSSFITSLGSFKNAKSLIINSSRFRDLNLLNNLQKLTIRYADKVKLDVGELTSLKEINIGCGIELIGNKERLKVKIANNNINITIKKEKEKLYVTALILCDPSKLHLGFDEVVSSSIEQPFFLPKPYDFSQLENLIIKESPFFNQDNFPVIEMDVSSFKNLKKLDLSELWGLKKIIGLEYCNKLEVLKLNLYHLQDNNILEKLPHLIHLTINGNKYAKRINSEKFACLPSQLEYLNLYNIPDLHSLNLGYLLKLKILSLSENYLISTEGIQQLFLPNSLKQLSLTDCNKLEAQIDITNLELIKISNCPLISIIKKEQGAPQQIELKKKDNRGNLAYLFKHADKKSNLPFITYNIDEEMNSIVSSQVEAQVQAVHNKDEIEENGMFYPYFEFAKLRDRDGLDFDVANKNSNSEAQRIFLNEKIHPSMYRRKIRRKLEIDEKGNVSIKEKSGKNLIPVKNLASQNGEPAEEFINIQRNQSYTLTGLSKNDLLCSFSPMEVFDIFKNEDNQYIIKLKADKYSRYEGTIYYNIYPDTKSIININQPIPLMEIIPKTNISLSEKAKLFLDKLLKQNQNLQLIANTIDSFKRLVLIVDYCRKFAQKDVIKGSNNWEKLADLISNQKGCCRHRVTVAMILCTYFGIAVNTNDNDCHQRIEIGPFIIDLGGSLVNLKINPLPSKNERKIVEVKSKRLELINPYEAQFMEKPQWLEKCKTFAEFIANINEFSSVPYLCATSSEQVKRCYRSFAYHAQTTKSNFIYIQDAVEMKQFLEATKIDDKIFKVEGPLAKLITNDEGIILINWSNFTKKERQLNQAVLNKLIIKKKKIKIFSLLDNNIISGLNSILLPDKLLINKITVPKLNPLTNIEVNLYYSDDCWMQTLIQNIEFKDDKICLVKGKLIEAIEKGYAITIINPPEKDVLFEQMLERLQVERKIFFNGEMLSVHPQFTFSIHSQPLDLRIPKAIQFKDGVPASPTLGKKYYINRTTFKYLFPSYKITSDNTLLSTRGILQCLQKNDCLIFTETLTEAEKAYLFDQLSSGIFENCKDITFYQAAEKDLANKNNLNINTANIHIETTDTHFLIQQLQKKYSIPDENIFYNIPNSAWSDLIERISLQFSNNFSVKREGCTFWEKLLGGNEKIILAGELSLEDQAMLETLFTKNPYLFVNGEYLRSKAQLFWVSKSQTLRPLLTPSKIGPDLIIQPTVNDYEYTLRKEVLAPKEKKSLNKKPKIMDETYWLAKVSEFFYYAQKLIMEKSPTAQHFTYKKYKQIYEAIIHYDNTSNPSKPFLAYHYQKNSEQYAYINVISKMLFYRKEKSTDFTKLSKVFSNQNLQNTGWEKILSENFWRIINCFTGEFIYLHFGISLAEIEAGNPPQPSGIVMAKLKKILHDFGYTKSNGPDDEQCFIDKNIKKQAQLHNALHDARQPLIFVIGEAGSGKTFSIRGMAKKHHYAYFEGEAQISNWLQNKDNNSPYIILLLDEGNMFPAHQLEFLRGLKHGTCNYKGKTYHLTQKHKVFITGNPLNFIGREFHDVLWDSAYLLWFAGYEEYFIENFVKNSLPDTVSVSEKIQISTLVATKFMAVSKNINKTMDITLREVENIVAKMCFYKNNARFSTWRDCAAYAIYVEFSSLLKDNTARCQLYTELNLKPPKSTRVKSSIFLPTTRQKLWDLIADDLLLRTQALNSNIKLIFKRGVLLEGPAKIGKRTLLEAILQYYGFKLKAANSQKRYYVVSAAEENVETILKKAHAEGSIVLLTNFNLKPELEPLLNSLLDPNMPGEKAGFMVLASQTLDKEIFANTKSLASRVHKILMDDYTVDELTEIAQQKNHPEPDKFALGFFKVKHYHAISNEVYFAKLNVNKN